MFPFIPDLPQRPPERYFGILFPVFLIVYNSKGYCLSFCKKFQEKYAEISFRCQKSRISAAF